MDDILTIKEVSEYLKIPVSTIYKLVNEGKVPAAKIGKHWRFRREEIDKLFLDKTRKNKKRK